MPSAPSGPSDKLVTPLWIAHHYPEDYRRCLVVGKTRVCCRCIVLYPIAIAVIVLALRGIRWSHSLDPWLLALLPLPSVTEFVMEHLGLITYRQRRQIMLTIPLAAALGVGFARYLHRPTDPLFWSMVAIYCGVCILATAIGSRRR